MLINNVFISLLEVVQTALGIYEWMIIISALLSWVNPDPYNPIVRFLRTATEPVLWRVRRVIGRGLGPVDISPLIVILVIVFLQKFIGRLIFDLTRGGIGI